MIRVELPYHLRTLARVQGREVLVEVPPPVTIGGVLDAVEARYPVLRGTIREHGTLRRRPFLRYYIGQEDWSHLPAETELPMEVTAGKEPFVIVGAIAGGRSSGIGNVDNGGETLNTILPLTCLRTNTNAKSVVTGLKCSNPSRRPRSARAPSRNAGDV
jgi:hypothetical protein